MPLEIQIKKKPYGNKIEMGVIAVPPGLEVPEGLEPGETFDLTTSYSLTPDGRLKPLFIEGVEIAQGDRPEESETDMEDEEPDEGRDTFMDGLNQLTQRV